MKKMMSSMTAKVIAIVILAAMFALCIASGFGIMYIYKVDGYTQSYKKVQQSVLNNIGTNLTYDAMNGFICGMSADELSDGAFCLTVIDENGKIVDDAVNGRETIWQSDVSIPILIDTKQSSWNLVRVNDESDVTITVPSYDDGETVKTDKYYLMGSILADYSNDSKISVALESLRFAFNNRYILVGCCIGSLIIGLIAFAFLMASAGHRQGAEGIFMSRIDRMPFDLFAAGCFLLGVLICGLLADFTGDLRDPLAIILISLTLLSLGFLLLWFFMSWAVRIKTRTALKSCICYKILRWCWHVFKRCLSYLAEILRNISLVKKTVLITAAVLLVEFLWVISVDSTGDRFIAWFIERAILATALIYSVVSVQKLRIAAREISDGNMNYKVDTSKMYGPFKAHGEDLNAITDGLNIAVGERMKSERFRTELITNVSHDIKTPLTSIVNYVDLLEKEKPENEKIREYLVVLSRQSEKLKKLIEDLLEASKASTGNVSVELRECDLGVFLDQCVGEYSDKLQAKGLTLVTSKPEQPLCIMADGRHMWRILDNLLNNACKYSYPGTRVYLSAVKDGDWAVLSLKNISAVMLNVSSEELMERFVRGDSSRSTEGSGLGLNIAGSLARVQGGELDISTDGDLFKAELRFKTI